MFRSYCWRILAQTFRHVFGCVAIGFSVHGLMNNNYIIIIIINIFKVA